MCIKPQHSRGLWAGGGGAPWHLNYTNLKFGSRLCCVSQFRRCSRPGCGKPAVATLTYAYADQTAVVGPLAVASEPHSWDLCEAHAAKITAPLGWELMRVHDIYPDADEDDDLTALAEAVREAGRHSSGLVVDDQPATPPQQRPVIQHRGDGAQGADGANHPVRRSKEIRAHRAQRRSHLFVVPDLNETNDDS